MKYCSIIIALFSLTMLLCGNGPTQNSETAQVRLTTTQSSSAVTIIRVPDKELYDRGEIVHVIADVNSSYTFTGWSGDTSSIDDTIMVVMNRDRTITANLKNASNKTVFSITANATNGSIFLSPAGDVQDSGAIIVAKAVPCYGSLFSGWSGTLSGKDTLATFALTKNTVITANFSIDPNAVFTTLSILPAPVHGTVTLIPQGVQAANGYKYKPGTVVTISEKPDSGYCFAGWTGDSAISDTSRSSFSVVLTKDFTAEAQFKRLPAGFSWTTRTTGDTLCYNKVIWTGIKIVAVGGGAVAVSSDGISWTKRRLDTSLILIDVAWTGNLLAAISMNGKILTSPDGLTWTLRDSVLSRLCAIVWTGKRLIAVDNVVNSRFSSNGINWESQYLSNLSFTTPTEMVRAGDTIYLVGLHNGSIFAGTAEGYYSTDDGNSWKSLRTGNSNGIYSADWTGSALIGCGRFGSVFFSMYDDELIASEWYPNRGDFGLRDLYGIAWTGEEAVAVGKSGIIIRSETGLGSWQSMISDNFNTLYSVAWAGTKLVAVGDWGTIITSP